MPIYGKTDLSGWAGARLPRLGELRKGAGKITKTKPNGETYEIVGPDLDYFRVTFQPQYKQFENIFIDLYGDTPAEFRNVSLMGSAPDEAFENWYEERTPTKLLHQCDGITQNVHYGPEGYSRDPIACAQTCNCTERGHLKVILGDFTRAASIWGYFSVETGSIYDILAIDGYLKFVSGFQGTLTGLRFILGRAPKEISAPNPKKIGDRMKITKHLLYLMVEPADTEAYLLGNFARANQRIASGQLDSSTGELTPGQLAIAPTSTPFDDDPFVPAQYDIAYDDVEPRLSYDLETVYEMTSGGFHDPVHQINAVALLQKNGEITPDMTTDEVIAVVKADRAKRDQEKTDDGSWWKDEILVRRFLAAVNTATNLPPDQILAALNTINPFDKQFAKWSQFKGTSKDRAWALVLLYVHHNDFEAAMKQAKDSPLIVGELANLKLNAAFSDHPF